MKRTQDKRLRSFTNLITKNVMSLFLKNNCNLPYEKISENNSKKIYEIDIGNFPLPFNFSPRKKYINFDPFVSVILEVQKNSNYFNVSGRNFSEISVSDLSIHLILNVPNDILKSKYFLLRDEIANSVRHELEHVSQGEIDNQMAGVYGRGKDYYSFIFSENDVDSSFAKYLMQKREIPAFVRGYSQISLDKNQFNKNIEEVLEIYLSKGLISLQEKFIIFKTWSEWCDRHINKKRF
jgi:hypothetical protein